MYSVVKMISKKNYTILTIAIITVLASGLVNTVSAITNGIPDNDNHPYVCLVVVDIWNGTHIVPAYRGTGILISPTIVLTAGHIIPE